MPRICIYLSDDEYRVLMEAMKRLGIYNKSAVVRFALKVLANLRNVYPFTVEEREPSPEELRSAEVVTVRSEEELRKIVRKIAKDLTKDSVKVIVTKAEPETSRELGESRKIRWLGTYICKECETCTEDDEAVKDFETRHNVVVIAKQEGNVCILYYAKKQLIEKALSWANTTRATPEKLREAEEPIAKALKWLHENGFVIFNNGKWQQAF